MYPERRLCGSGGLFHALTGIRPPGGPIGMVAGSGCEIRSRPTVRPL